MSGIIDIGLFIPRRDFGLLAWLIGVVVALLSFLLSLGFWGIIIILVIFAVAAAFE